MESDIKLTKEEISILQRLESDEMAGEPKGDLLNASQRLAELNYVTNDSYGYLVVTAEGKKWLEENLPKENS